MDDVVWSFVAWAAFIVGMCIGACIQTSEAEKVCDARGGVYAKYQCYKAEVM